MAQLRQARHHFEDADAQILMVGMGTPEQSAAFREKLDLPFPMVSDPRRRLYNAMHIGFMSLAGALSPRVAMRAFAALSRGHRVGMPHGDVRQLPAVYIIDANGNITHSHIGEDAADHPDPQEILEVL